MKTPVMYDGRKCTLPCRLPSSADPCRDLVLDFGPALNRSPALRSFSSFSVTTQLWFVPWQVVLAAGSAYFRTMFASGMEESRKDVIEIKQIEAAVFQQVLRFIYTGRVDIGGATVQELFMQAQMFQIAQLVELCVTFFQVRIRRCVWQG